MWSFLVEDSLSSSSDFPVKTASLWPREEHGESKARRPKQVQMVSFFLSPLHYEISFNIMMTRLRQKGISA